MPVYKSNKHYIFIGKYYVNAHLYRHVVSKYLFIYTTIIKNVMKVDGPTNIYNR